MLQKIAIQRMNLSLRRAAANLSTLSHPGFPLESTESPDSSSYSSIAWLVWYVEQYLKGKIHFQAFML